MYTIMQYDNAAELELMEEIIMDIERCLGTEY